MAGLKSYEFKCYGANECCLFRKTKELYGGLSNMASGFPLVVNNNKILSSEALYQSCRFPHLPDIQKKIIDQKSPMTAKMVGKPFRINSRPDWDELRIKIMRWCLKVKLAQNVVNFGKLLESTYNKTIVEDSSKDNFWGAIRQKDDLDLLVGVNALGRLLMELREFYNQKRLSYDMFVVEPLNIPDFKLYGIPITVIDEREAFFSYLSKSLFYDIVIPKLNNSPKGYHLEPEHVYNVFSDLEVPFKSKNKLIKKVKGEKNSHLLTEPQSSLLL